MTTGIMPVEKVLLVRTAGRCHGLKRGIKVRSHVAQVRDGVEASYRCRVPLGALRSDTVVFADEKKRGDCCVWIFADECSVLGEGVVDA